MDKLTIRWCLLGILVIGLCGPKAATSNADSTSILGTLVAHEERSIEGLSSYRIVWNRVLVETRTWDSSGTIMTFERANSILDPATLEVLWSVAGNLCCYPTCNRCAEPCIACETVSKRDKPDTIHIFDMAGNLLHQQTYPSDLLNTAGISPPTTSSPRGRYFFISWCSGYDSFPVYGRDGRLLFETEQFSGFANEAYALSDSLIVIPMYLSPDSPGEFYETPILEVLSVPEGRLVASVLIPSSHRYGNATFVISPGSGRALAYSHDGQVSLIGPDLSSSWSERLLQHVNQAAFSDDGRFLALVGRDTAAAVDGPLKLLFVDSDSGRIIWSRLLPSGCDNQIGGYSSTYLAGRVIRVGGRDFTLLVTVDSSGARIAEECCSKQIDLMPTDQGYITISRSGHDDRTLISDTWHVSR